MRRVALAFAMATLSLSSVETQPYRNLGDWHLSLLDADRSGRTFRLYDTPRELRVSLAMTNVSGLHLAYDAVRLRERVSISMSGDAPISIVATWPSNISARKDQWTVTLTRRDGQPFAAGRYQIDASVRAAYQLMRTPDGQPLRGVEHQSVNVAVDILPPANARETSAALRLRARQMLANDTVERLRLLVLATEADPSDIGALLDLGRAYVDTRRCEEAVSTFERARQLQRKLPQTIGYAVGLHGPLAHAHVCGGNEARAAQVLRDAGESEAGIADSIERYRRSFGR